MLRGCRPRVAVVTGAAGGLGRALARDLAAREARLAPIDIDAAAIAGAVAELTAAGAAVSCHAIDVGSEDAVRRAAQDVARAHGAAHLLVNNAAVSASAAVTNTEPAEFERILRVNLLGVVHGCRAFLPLLRSPDAQILNVSGCFADGLKQTHSAA